MSDALEQLRYVDAKRERGTSNGGAPREPNKTIVLFADGTGNAFKSQESNIWRLYCALDVQDPTQIAHYIPGVGTSGFRPWALIDGVTGLGVPANVRRLYAFLCWNYVPGDKIYMFGFSRGAFTIRALIGVIDAEGLVSRHGPNGIAARREMRRNVMSAWRAYRGRRRRSWRQEAPTIKLTRAIRDAILWMRDFTFGHERYHEVRNRSDFGVKIRFVGLFDTVEAYGVPLEEMRDAIDWAVWPIKYPDRRMSAKVEAARHALSLDDERQTFWPVRIDLSQDQDWDTARIREAWFSGVHSDVGGGYPDDRAAFVSLNWMLDELPSRKGRPELNFLPDQLAAMRAGGSSLASNHDSRAGLYVLYRYAPRLIGKTPADGGAPTVHHSVVERMVFGSDQYAPHALPADANVLMPDGLRRPMRGVGAKPPSIRGAHASAGSQPKGSTAQELAEHALEALGVPRPDYVEAVRRGAWLRRKVSFALLFGVLALATFPWLSAVFDIGLRADEPSDFGFFALASGVLTAFAQDIAVAVGQLVPGYAQPWFKGAVAQPPWFLITLALTAGMYWLNGWLRDRIADDARCAWFGSGGPADPEKVHRRFSQRLAVALSGAWFHKAFARLGYAVWFGATLAVLGVAAVLYVARVLLSRFVGAGGLCQLAADRTDSNKPRRVFTPSSPCWDTGVDVEQGRAYRITITMREDRPFLDRSLVADIGGFSGGSWVHALAAPLKRWWTAAYFQPIARIGRLGMTELLLRPESGQEPITLSKDAHVPSQSRAGACEPVTADPNDIAALQSRFGLQRSLVSRFVAPKSGPLFLYVNDAMLGSIWIASLVGGQDCFYRNNAGAATVHVEMIKEDASP